MQVAYASLKAGAPDLADMLSATRSRRNLLSRGRAEAEDGRAEAVRRRRKKVDEREAEAFLRQRVRVRCSDGDRPKLGSKTARRLYHRTMERLLPGTKGASSSRGTDGLHSIHYAFTARGFGSRTGRRWKTGEAERAARYAVREDALEGDEHGWWSNIAADRAELVAHYRALEMLEKHDRKNANVYIVEVIALPAELTARQRRLAVRRICGKLERRGLGYTVGIHRPDANGDQRNHHLHLIYSLRPVRRVGPFEWEFGTEKVGDINNAAGIRRRRQEVVRAINMTLAAAHINKRYTALSNRARGIAAPTKGKVGQAATWTERRLAAIRHRIEMLSELHRRCVDLADAVIRGDARFERARARSHALYTAVASAIRDIAEIPRNLRNATARHATLHMMNVSGSAKAATRAHDLLGGRLGAAMNGMQDSLIAALVDPRSSAVAGVATGGLERCAASVGNAIVQADLRLARIGFSPAKAEKHGTAVVEPIGIAAEHPPPVIADRGAERLTSRAGGGSGQGPVTPASFAKRMVEDIEQEGRSLNATPSTEGNTGEETPKVSTARDGQVEADEVLHRGLLQQRLRDRAAELRSVGLKLLREKAARIKVDEDDRCTIDMSSIPALYREALLQPAFDAGLQRALRQILLDQSGTCQAESIVTAPADGKTFIAAKNQTQRPQSEILEINGGESKEARLQARRRAGSGFNSPKGMASMRGMRTFYMASGQDDAESMVRADRGGNVRGGRANDQDLRGVGTGCMNDAGVKIERRSDSTTNRTPLPLRKGPADLKQPIGFDSGLSQGKEGNSR